MKTPDLHHSIHAAIQGCFVLAVVALIVLSLFGVGSHVVTWFEGANPLDEGVYSYVIATANNLIALVIMVVIGWMVSCVLAIVLAVMVNLIHRLGSRIFNVKSWALLMVTASSGYLAGYLFENHSTAVLGLAVALSCFYYYLKCWYYLLFNENPELNGHEWLQQKISNPIAAMLKIDGYYQ